MLSDFFAQRLPVHLTRTRHFDFLATLLLEYIQCILRHQTTVPFGTLIAAVSAVLSGNVAGCFVGIIGDGFHELVVKFNSCLRCKCDVFLVERVLQPHDTEPDRTVATIGSPGRFSRIEVDVDHVIEGTHCDANRLTQFGMIEVTIGIKM